MQSPATTRDLAPRPDVLALLLTVRDVSLCCLCVELAAAEFALYTVVCFMERSSLGEHCFLLREATIIRLFACAVAIFAHGTDMACALPSEASHSGWLSSLLLASLGLSKRHWLSCSS